jgi:hypothetical protein
VVAIVDHGWVLIRDRGLVARNHRAASGNVRWGGVRVLACVKELGDSWMGLGTTRNLVGMRVGNTVLVNWRRGGIVGKLVARGWGSRSGGLAGLNRVNSDSMGNLFYVFRRACIVGIVIAVVLHILLIIELSRGYDNLNLATEHQVETVAPGGLVNTRKARSIVPLVQLPTKCVGFDLEHAKFASSNQPVTARSVDVSNRGIDDGGLGGATNLRKVWQKTSEIQETTIESLTTLSLDSVVGRSSLGGVCPSAGLSFSSRGGGDHSRVGIGVSIRERLSDRRGRQWGGGSRSTVRRARGDLKRHCHREKLR